MALKKYKVEDLKPGMVFDKAVYIDENNILAAPMVPIKEVDINRLIKWGIEEVETAGVFVRQEVAEKEKKRSAGEDAGQAGESKDIRTVWDDTYKLVEDIFEKTRNGAAYDKNVIMNGVDDLLVEMSKDVNRALSEVTISHQGKYLYNLGVNVSILSMATGFALGYGKEKLTPLGVGGLLHDIGMVRVPSYIIEKEGALTPDEFNRVKTHTVYGYRVVLNEIGLDNEIAEIVMQHHEMFDGSGYPRKLKGKDISVYARIVAVCDVFAAMIKKRSYREEHMSYFAMKNILGGSNRKYDPDIVKAFLSSMAIYPVGSVVELNNGTIAKVVSANPELPLRPKLVVEIDEFGVKPGTAKMIDLETEKSLFIKKPVSTAELKHILGEE
jgi:HD-GYP domain-containing protein (c-di-GMP phosphodiesterase class II)